LAVLHVLFADGLLEKGAKLGEKVLARLEEMQSQYGIIGEVRGKGAMLGLELVKDRETKEPAPDEAKKLTQLCYDDGLVILSCGKYGNVIRTLMPLVITDDQLERGLQILEENISKLQA
jgi:4-aminobutyrate aminotransferase/(S)-3-amino-2-methylpropionate transaminase